MYMKQEVISSKKSRGNSILRNICLIILTISLIISLIDYAFISNDGLQAIFGGISGIGILLFLFYTDFSENAPKKATGMRIWEYSILILGIIRGIWEMSTWLF